MIKTRPLAKFLGLNNRLDPMVGSLTEDGKPLTWEWQIQADNVNLTDSGRYVRRDGYRPFIALPAVSSAFSTFDYQRLYVVSNGELLQCHDDGSTVLLADGLAGDVWWAEANDIVYVSGRRKLEILPDGTVREWGVPTPAGCRVTEGSGRLAAGRYQVCLTYTDSFGREGGASVARDVAVTAGGIVLSDIPTRPGCYTNIYLADRGTVFSLAAMLPFTVTAFSLATPPVGRDLTTPFVGEPPAGMRQVCYFQGRLYGAEPMPEANMTAVWFSQPLGYHLFGGDDGYLAVPGEVVQLGATLDDGPGALVICTRDEIFTYDGERLVRVAAYGSPPGLHMSRSPDKKLYFWTTRGLCRAVPFENLTEGRVSVPPGVTAGGAIFHQHGYVRYVATLQGGGAAFNKR